MKKIIFLACISLILNNVSLQAAYPIGLGVLSKKSLCVETPSQAILDRTELWKVDRQNNNPFFDIANFSDWQGVLIDGKRISYQNDEGVVVETIELPFEYKTLSKEEIEEVYFVPQNRMTIIENGEVGLLAPLNPCHGVCVTLPDSSATLAIHVDIDQKSSDVVSAIEDFLNKKGVSKDDYNQVKVVVYAMKSDDQNDALRQKGFSNDLLISLQNEFKKLKVFIVDNYFKMLKNESSSAVVYCNAASSILVTSDGRLSNTCFVTEVVKMLPKAKDIKTCTKENYNLLYDISAYYVNIGITANFMFGPAYTNKSVSKLGDYLNFQITQNATMHDLLKKD